MMLKLAVTLNVYLVHCSYNEYYRQTVILHGVSTLHKHQWARERHQCARERHQWARERHQWARERHQWARERHQWARERHQWA